MRTRVEIINGIINERERQVEQEGWTSEHDARHKQGQLAMAAACYAASEKVFVERDVETSNDDGYRYFDAWPWDQQRDKRQKHDRKRQLEIAAALIIAELERLERAAFSEDEGNTDSSRPRGQGRDGYRFTR